MPYFYEDVQLTSSKRSLENGASPCWIQVALLHHTTTLAITAGRWTLRDLEFRRQIFSRFEDVTIRVEECWIWFTMNPGWMEINAVCSIRPSKTLICVQ